MTARVLTVRRRVHAPPAHCFAVFTDGVDRWWQRGPRFRRWRASTVAFEGDRLWERHGDQAALVATVTAWEPPRRLVLDLAGERVEIDFVPDDDATTVTVRHHRDDRLTDFQDAQGLWWSDLLVPLARHILLTDG